MARFHRTAASRWSLVIAACSLAACGSDEVAFVEPSGIVIWSTDDSPAVLPADSPLRSDPQLSVDELRNATVVADAGDRIVVVGDSYQYAQDGVAEFEAAEPYGGVATEFDGYLGRYAYLLEQDGRVVHLLGVIDGDSDLSSTVPGRRVGAALDRTATTAFATTSADIHEVPVHTDPGTGQVFAFYDAPPDETLLRLDAYDAEGNLTDSVVVAEPAD